MAWLVSTQAACLVFSGAVDDGGDVGKPHRRAVAVGDDDGLVYLLPD